MSDIYLVSPLLPAALERLERNAAALRRAIRDLPAGGELPADSRARAPLAVVAQDLLDEARGITKHLESLLEILRR